MYRLFLVWRTALLSMVLTGLAAAGSFAQVQYASSVAGRTGTVTDEAKAVDGDLASSAVIVPLLGSTSLRLRFALVAAASKPAGLYLKPNALIGAALLSKATLNTYAQGGTTALESYPLSNTAVVSLTGQPAGVTQLQFTPTQAFTDIELVFASTLAVGQDIAIYEAYSTPVPLPLPVVLAAWQGLATPAGVALSWQTATEANADHFVVERAADRAADFRALGRVAAAGQSARAQGYQFTDVAPVALGYYRLRQVDHDGTTTFSPVLAVAARPVPTSLVAYPSPARATLTVAGAAGVALEIVDYLGRPVQRVAATPAAVQQLNVRPLPPGTYFVRNEATGQRTRFVKAADL